MTGKADTPPFAPFEWLLALRYLRARRKEGFISVIAGFSFIGIMLGVATLIIVMAVMNGFRNQLYEKILGLNGHAVVQPMSGTGPFTNYDDIAQRLAAIDGVHHAVPLIEGQVMVSSPHHALGGLVRGMTEFEAQGAGRVHLYALGEPSLPQQAVQVGQQLGGVALPAMPGQLGQHIPIVNQRQAGSVCRSIDC